MKGEQKWRLRNLYEVEQSRPLTDIEKAFWSKGGLVDSFSQLYFTINLEEIFYFNNKKCRIYAVFGVSQTPI